MTDAISRSNAISRSAALSMMDEYIDLARDEELHHAMCVVAAGLAELPTLDVAPVVHARWIDLRESYSEIPAGRCSNCGVEVAGVDSDVNYCFSCGAKMDEGMKDEG